VLGSADEAGGHEALEMKEGGFIGLLLRGGGGGGDPDTRRLGGGTQRQGACLESQSQCGRGGGEEGPGG
jgi:hypothetical protein